MNLIFGSSDPWDIRKKLIFCCLSLARITQPKHRFLGQKVCSVAHRQTDMKVKTEDTLSGFQDFFQIFHQPIKERSNFWGIYHVFFSYTNSKMMYLFTISSAIKHHSYLKYFFQNLHFDTFYGNFSIFSSFFRFS